MCVDAALIREFAQLFMTLPKNFGERNNGKDSSPNIFNWIGRCGGRRCDWLLAYQKALPQPFEKNLGEGEAALTPYVLVDQSGVTIIAPRAEMGQGVRTTLAALVAEELDIGLEDVTVVHGPASKAYYNAVIFEEAASKAVTDESAGAERMRAMTHIVTKLMGNQITGGSSTIPDAYNKMREAGAAARTVLIEAGAQKLGVRANDLTTKNGKVVSPDGTQIPYTDLAELAAKIKPPSKPTLKPKSEWKILGKSLDRIDMREKCTGEATYAIDVRLPGMLYATVKTNPHLESSMLSYDATLAETKPGVKKIVPLDNGVGVVATNTWAAFQAAEEIKFEWEKASYPASTNEMIAGVALAFKDKPDSQDRDDGNVELALSETDSIELEYAVPYLAHSTMEPMNAVAMLKDGHLDVWVGTQSPTRCLTIAAEVAKLKEDEVTIHTTWLGGGFGRRGETDYVRQAVQIAVAMEGSPVKMTWTREEDMRHDMYRPLTLARFRGGGKKGHRLCL